jgi:hypothetical protein
MLGDLWYAQVGENGEYSETPFVRKEIAGGAGSPGTFSPNGRFVAYVSNESGQNEIYVRPFPAGEGKWRVSSDGGFCPRWRRDGKELFFLEGSGTVEFSGVSLMAAGVATDSGFSLVGSPQRLFRWERPGPVVPHFDVSPDGQRFLFSEPVEPDAPPVIRLVQNWYEEFRGR